MPNGASGDWVSDFFIRHSDWYLPILGSAQMVSEGVQIAQWVDYQVRLIGVGKARILDVGSGLGRVSIPLGEIGHTVVGVDISRRFVEEARRRALERGLGDKVVFILGDARRLKDSVAEYAPFDAAIFIFTSVLGYYDEETDLEILRQAFEVVKPGGLLIIDVVDKEWGVKVNGRTLVIDVDDAVAVQLVSFDPSTARIRSRWRYYAKQGGMPTRLRYLGESMVYVRAYSLGELADLARRAGWVLKGAYSCFCNEPYIPGFGRLVAVFKRP